MRARLRAAAEAVFLVCLLLAPWPYGSAPDEARYLLCALLLLAGAGWAAGRALEGRGLPPLALPAAGLPALGLLQAALGVSAAWVWTLEAVVVSAAMLTTLVFWSERSRDPAAATRLATAVLATCAAQAVFGAVQWQVAPDRVYGHASPFLTTPFGSYVNHNHFAGLLEMGAVLAAGLAVARIKRDGGPSPLVLALSSLSLGLVAAHLASRSRGGLIALVGGLALLALLWLGAPSRKPADLRRRLGMAASGAAVLLAFGLLTIPSSTREHLATVLRGASDTSGEYRVDVAWATLRLAIAHPFLGSGLGAYADAFPAVKHGHGDVRTTHAESDVLEFLAEGGLAGLAVLAGLGFAIARGLTDRLAHGRNSLRKGLALSAAAAAGALVIHSLVDFNLRLPANALAFVCLLGLASAPSQEGRPWGARWSAALVGLLLLVTAVLAAWRGAGAAAFEGSLETVDPHRRIGSLSATLAWHPYLAEGYRERALVWRALASTHPRALASRLGRAEEDLERALALRPRWAEAWADLAWLRELRGDTRAAHSAFDRASSLDPTHLAAGLAHADFLARVQGAASGVERLARLRRANPDWPLPQVLSAATRWTTDRSLLLGLTDGSPEEKATVEAALRSVKPVVN